MHDPSWSQSYPLTSVAWALPTESLMIVWNDSVPNLEPKSLIFLIYGMSRPGMNGQPLTKIAMVMRRLRPVDGAKRSTPVEALIESVKALVNLGKGEGRVMDLYVAQKYNQRKHDAIFEQA